MDSNKNIKRYVEAPTFNIDIANLNPNDNLFLAGSITGSRDWQKDICEMWSGGRTLQHKYNVFNPRRVNFDKTNPIIEQEQITWEYHCINNMCGNILFWFSSETVAPITLFEYGKALKTHNPKRIFVGVDPKYPRLNDVIIQTRLEYPELADKIQHDLGCLFILAMNS